MMIVESHVNFYRNLYFRNFFISTEKKHFTNRD